MTDKKDDLERVAKHGSGPIERALAVVKLAEREGSVSYLKKLLDYHSENNGEE